MLAGGAMTLIVLVAMYQQNPLSHAAVICQNIAMPAFAPATDTTFWNSGISAKPPLHIMIANPSNGPGASADPDFVAAIAAAQATGIDVLGYVETANTAVAPTTAEQDIDRWKTFYNVTDIFFDHTSVSASDLSYYQSLANKVHLTAGATVMLNPGQTPDEAYMALSQIVNIFEGIPSTFATFTMPTWAANYDVSRFSSFIYAVPDAATMKLLLAQSRTANIGYVYVTSDDQPNPYDNLPTFWSDEVAEIKAACAAPPPPAPAPATNTVIHVTGGSFVIPTPPPGPTTTPSTPPASPSTPKAAANSDPLTLGSVASTDAERAAAQKARSANAARNRYLLWAAAAGGFVITGGITTAGIVICKHKLHPIHGARAGKQVIEPFVHRPPPGTYI